MSLAKVFQILQDLNRKFCSVADSLLFLILGFRTKLLFRLLLDINTFSKSPRGSLNFNILNISINELGEVFSLCSLNKGLVCSRQKSLRAYVLLKSP